MLRKKITGNSLWSIIVVVAIIIGSIVYGYTSTSQVAGANTQVEQIRVTQNIIGAVKPVDTTYRGEVQPGTTALQLLKEQAEVKTKGEGKNAYVIEINGKTADEANREFWAFYINGVPSNVGAGSYQLKNGDVIEWKIDHY